jgi:Flp pilus assembly protein TadD
MKTATLRSTRIVGLAVTTALATTTLGGCAGKAAPSAAMSAEGAKAALVKGQGDKAVAFAEAAVLAAPRDGASRALLGAAYLEAGRFASAATALNDAIQLGETSGRTVLTYSLALSALGRYAEAQALLVDHERRLDPADYGLAITLAGSPRQGVETLSNALRYGENTPKLRQNLAYAFALNGDWRSARLLAAQDVTADRLDQRLGEWAALSTPQMAVQRVAVLLGVTAKATDGGQPVHLALTNFPTNEQLAAESATQDAAPAPVPAPVPGAVLASAELPAADAIAAPAEETALAAHEPAAAPAAISYTPAAPRIVLPRPTPATAPARVAVARKPVAAVPVPAKPSPAFRAAFVRQPGAYRVQLGSYASASGASDAWTRFQKRHPELKGAERVVTKARVNGKTYYRVAASGFAKASALSFCSLVKTSGGGCLAYASSRTLPGAVANSAPRAAAVKPATRVAAR